MPGTSHAADSMPHDYLSNVCGKNGDVTWVKYFEIEMRRKDISSDESLQQGRNRSRELNFSP